MIVIVAMVGKRPFHAALNSALYSPAQIGGVLVIVSANVSIPSRTTPVMPAVNASNASWC